MANHHPLTYQIDCPEPRVLLDRLIVTAGGSPDRGAWSQKNFSGCWRDPILGQVMLRPLPLTETWRTTTTGAYARLAKTDYTLTTGAAWVENHRDVAGNIYLEGNGTNELVRTTATYPADQPWFVSLYVPGIESMGEQTVLECGWGPPGGSTTISLRFRANGQVSIWRGTNLLDVSDVDYSNRKTEAVLSSVGRKTVNLLLMPTRPRDGNGTVREWGNMLIVTDAGGGYGLQISDLGPTDPVVASGYFWWQVPTGRPCVQVAPLKFETSGYVLGPAQALRYAPASPRVFTANNYYSSLGPGTPTAVASLVKVSDGSAYSPDGVTTQVRIRVDFAGDGASTIAVDAIDAICERVVTTTTDEPIDITPAIQEPELRVADDRKGYITLKGRRKDLEALGISGLLETGDRTFRVFTTTAGGAEIDLMRGTLSKPRLEIVGGSHTGGDLIVWEGQDRSAEFDYASYTDTVADDGLLFTDAVKRHVEEAGFERTTDISTSTSTFRLPTSATIGLGEWALLPRRGDTVGAILDQRFDTFAADWWRLWAPTLGGYRYLVYSPGDLTTAPAITLYEDRADALAAGMASDLVPHRTLLVSSAAVHRPPAEANQILVIGQDPATRRLILAQANNAASQTPGTAAASRDKNWRGRVHRVQVIDPGITSQSIADASVGALSTRLLSERYIRDLVCSVLIRTSDARPIWAGDVVRVVLRGGATYEDYRIMSIPVMTSVREYTTTQVLTEGQIPIRRATYRGERIALGSL